MFSEQLFDMILNFGDDWKVERVYLNIKTEEVDVYVKFISQTYEHPETFEPCSIYDHAPIRRWRHLDIMQYKTYINCSVPRIKDKQGRVLTIRTPWADSYERHTYLFERMAIDILQSTKNQTKTAQLLRCGFNVINRIIHNSVERGLRRRPTSYAFEHICIDEKSFKKGHTYVTVVSDPISGIVVDVAKDREYSSCKHAIQAAIPEKQMQAVKTVTMDMWKPYMSATKDLLPQSDIVHDRFHLVKYLNDAVDKVRRREVKKHDELKHTKYIFLKNPEKQTEKQRIKFNSIAQANYEVSRAWQVKENFRDIFGCDSITEAFSLVFQWLGHATRTNITEINAVVNTFRNHLNGIINAMVNTFSNAMAERLNGKIQEVKACARGYRKFQNFRNAILFFHGGLLLYPLN